MNGQKFPRSNSGNRRSRGRGGGRTSIKFPYFECQIRNQMETVFRIRDEEFQLLLAIFHSSLAFSSSHVPSLIELRERRRFHSSRIRPPTPLARSPAQLNFGPNLGGLGRPKRPSSLVDRPLGPCAYEVYNGGGGVEQKQICMKDIV